MKTDRQRLSTAHSLSTLPRCITAVNEMCLKMKKLRETTDKERALRIQLDLIELKNKSESFKKEDDMVVIANEAVMGIVSNAERKRIIRGNIMRRMKDETELANELQKHKDEFCDFICRRRVADKNSLKLLFHKGPSVICKIGDLISDSSTEGIQLFEQANLINLCQDSIQNGFSELDDIPAFFLKEVFFVQPKLGIKIPMFLLPSRLEMELSLADLPIEFKADTNAEILSQTPELPGEPRKSVSPRKSKLKSLIKAPTPVKDNWYSIYSSTGIHRAKLLAKPFFKDLAIRTREKLLSNETSKLSCLLIVARLIDLIHPTHQLQSVVLSVSESNAMLVIKKRLATLGYLGFSNKNNDDMVQYPDVKWGVFITKQLISRLDKEMRGYFEFSSIGRNWRIGFTAASYADFNQHKTYPGETKLSMGFGSDGLVYYNGQSMEFKLLPAADQYIKCETYGIVIDLYKGYISLVVEGKEISPPAFGKGSSWAESIIEEQYTMIKNQELHIMTSMLAVRDANYEKNTPKLIFNFAATGPGINASTFGQQLNFYKPKDASEQMYTLFTFAPLTIMDHKEKTQTREEDEKNQLNAEKNLYRNALAIDALKSFSKFPPSVFRRTISAKKIQRAWRRYQARKARKVMLSQRYCAATVIQHAAAKFLRKLLERKNSACFVIQKNWRITMYLKVALLRCVYRKPISELHYNAKIIQSKYRYYKFYKNSPMKVAANIKLHDIQKAIAKIILWWRPICQRRIFIRNQLKRKKAAINIQRIYRGYALRQLLRPDLKNKLYTIGRSVANHRMELVRIHAAYKIQRGWRAMLQKRIRFARIKSMHQASARIQSAFRGYWVRSHIHMRFSYGETIYLKAVRNNLIASHFILKMYKPCGIVCPKKE